MLYIALINVVFSIIALASLIIVIWKTEKGLDHSFKLYLGAAIMALVGTFLDAQRYLGSRVLMVDPYQTLFTFLFLVFFVAGTILFLVTIVEESHNKE